MYIMISSCSKLFHFLGNFIPLLQLLPLGWENCEEAVYMMTRKYIDRLERQLQKLNSIKEQNENEEEDEDSDK